MQGFIIELIEKYRLKLRNIQSLTIFIVSNLFCIFYASSQTVYYVNVESDFSDTIANPFFPVYNKIYYNDSNQYTLSSVLCSSDSDYCSIKFFIDSDSNWYIIDNEKKILFFENASLTGHRLAIKDFVLTFTCDTLMFSNRKIYLFNITKIGAAHRNYISNQGFDPEWGIVYIEWDFGKYIREDYFFKYKH